MKPIHTKIPAAPPAYTSVVNGSAPVSLKKPKPASYQANPSPEVAAAVADANERIAYLESCISDLYAKLEQLRAAVVIQADGSVELYSPMNVTIAAGKEACVVAGSKVTLDCYSSGVTCSADGTLKLAASQPMKLNVPSLKVIASVVTLDTPLAKVTGTVKTDVLNANSVIATSYTPGAGNIW